MNENQLTSEELAKRIRRHVLDMTHNAHASHIGGMLSVADIIAVLYTNIVKFDPLCENWSQRDRVILSKGHNGAAMYAVLAEKGFFDLKELDEYGKNGSKFSCHISHKDVPGVEISTGSLGQGVCVAAGMALDAKLKGRSNHVYAIVGDGECNEGAVWEMSLMAAQYGLDNFTVIIDRNNMQAMGFCKEVINTDPLLDKWNAFGWFTVEVLDGNNHQQLRDAFSLYEVGKPKVIIANTVKGKGISFMENQLLWHYRDPQGDFYNKAIEELEREK